MRFYQYKIQWLLPVRRTFDAGEISDKERLKELRNTLNVLGINSLNSLILRDNNLKKIDYYDRQIMFSSNKIALDEFMKWLRLQLKNDSEKKITYVELYRSNK